MAEEPYIDLITGKPVEQWVADAMARPRKQAMAEVTQADREAAASYLDIWAKGCDLNNAVREGKSDQSPLVQAFVAHRTEAVKPLVEALENVVAPLALLQREAEARGNRLSGAAYSIANDLGFVQKIARDALEAFRSEQL